MRTSAIVVYLVLASVALPGCNILSDSDSEDVPLVGTKWTLQEIIHSNGNWISADGRSNFVIFQEDGTAEGKADCNTCHGDYLVEGSSLEIGFGCTRIYCGEESKGDEFQLGLLQATAYRISGDRLSVTTDGGNLLFQAER